MSFADFLENKVLDHLLGATAYSAPATVYVGVSTTTPNDDGSNFSEPSGYSYARVTVINNTTNWPNASSGLKKNGADIAFPTATGSWGTVTHFALFDDPTAGNMLLWGPLAEAKLVSNGDTLKFLANDLQVLLD